MRTLDLNEMAETPGSLKEKADSKRRCCGGRQANRSGGLELSPALYTTVHLLHHASTLYLLGLADKGKTKDKNTQACLGRNLSMLLSQMHLVDLSLFSWLIPFSQYCGRIDFIGEFSAALT